jgi:GNAT superfamily N-acetyltransferase
MEVVPASTPEQIALIRTLFEEYWASFHFTPCFQNFSTELAALPGAYAPPEGRLVLAMAEGDAAGCIALRKFDEGRCEFKRLYVRDRYRSHGVGRALLDWVIAEARAAGYPEMLGDTMPQMGIALSWYDRFGFERITPYRADPAPEAIHIRLRL